MVRPLRIEFPGAIYHITSRGNARGNIFLEKTDREKFLTIVDEVLERYHWICYGYCLMNNHYHIIIETPEGNLSKGMRHINGVYTQYFNWRHNNVGHIFQGRFSAILIQKERHLLELCRYVILNPVRAGIVDLPEKWQWSNYKAICEASKTPIKLDIAWVLSNFSNDENKARQLYKTFIYEGMMEDSPWNKIKGRVFLGNDEFISEIHKKIDSNTKSTEISKKERYANRPGLKELFNFDSIREKGMDTLIYKANVHYGYSQFELADYLKKHYSTISKKVRGIQKRLNSRIKT